MQVFESGEVQDMCGEDVSFCLDAKDEGFEIWCDPRIRVSYEKLVSSDRFDILYAGEKIYQNLSHEACLDIMQDLAERYYESPSEGKDMFDANLISMEECTNG